MKRLLAMALAVFSCAAADLYKVAGVVVNADTGAPLPDAYVALTKTGSTKIVNSTVTAGDGRFAFDLPQGKFTLRAGPRTAIASYGSRPDNPTAVSVVTGPGQDTSSLVFRWYAVGSISGRILDDQGEPVENALVQLVRSGVLGGNRVTDTFGWSRTDDRGEYRFGRLPASTYYLVVTGRPWYSQGMSGEKEPSLAYAPVYYPDSLDARGAKPLILKSGEEARADFAVHAVPGADVKIAYEGMEGAVGTVALIMEGLGAAEGFERQEHLNPYGQILGGVAPGRYLLRVRANRNGAPISCRQAIEVAGGEIEVKMSPAAAPTLSGTVQMLHPDMRPRGTVLIRLTDIDTHRGTAAVMRPDGSFSATAPMPGKYRIFLGGSDGYFASQVTVAGATFHDQAIEIADGAAATVQIVASDETGRVQGLAISGDKPVAGVLVVLAPVSDDASAPSADGFETDSDGSFDYENIPAGDYFLFIPDTPATEYANRDAIRQYFAQAKRVHVVRHESLSLRIDVPTASR